MDSNGLSLPGAFPDEASASFSDPYCFWPDISNGDTFGSPMVSQGYGDSNCGGELAAPQYQRQGLVETTALPMEGSDYYEDFGDSALLVDGPSYYQDPRQWDSEQVLQNPWYQTDDSLLQVYFEPHEIPLGLVMDWTHPLPVVSGVLPGSYAELHEELRPGLVVLSINNVEVMPDADPWEVQQLFAQRPLLIVFDCRMLPCEQVSPQTSQSLREAPNQIYELGESYRAISRLVMREQEALNSRIIAECLVGAVLKVMEHGVGETGRRLMVFAAGHIGWVSCMSEAGQVLIATKPALLIPPQGAASSRGAARQKSISDEKLWHTNVMEEIPGTLFLTGDDRKSYFAGILKERAMKAKVEEQRNDMLVRRKRRRPMMQRLRSMTEKVKPLSAAAMAAQDSVTRAAQDLDEDSTDSECNEEELLAALGLPKENHDGHSAAFLKQMAAQLDEFKASLDEDRSCRARCQRCLGIQWLKVKAREKNLKVLQKGPSFPAVTNVVNDLRFELVVGVAIMLNATSMAMETFYRDGERRPMLINLAEHFFTAVFLIEWTLRVLDSSWLYFLSLWNLFDTFLVWITGVLVMWILVPIGVDASLMRRFGCVRMLRLARLCRAIRLMPFFKELWMLVQGIMECVSLLSWSLIVGCVVHYTFAVACLELIAKTPAFENNSDVQNQFNTVFGTMFTLFQIMTFDSWANIVRPIVQEDPKSCLIFFAFMGLAGIVLFNLLTAIVVRNAFDSAEADVDAVSQYKLEEAQKVKTELYNMFQDLDEDGSGFLSIEEFLDCMDDFAFIRRMKTLDIDLEELPDIFEILDDGDGEVDQEEFIIGMLHLQGPAMSSEMLKATALMSSQNDHFSHLEDSFVENALETFRSVDQSIDQSHDCMTEVMQLLAEVVVQLDKIGLRQVIQNTVGALKIPYIDDPDIEELQKRDEQRKKEERRGSKAGHKASKRAPSHIANDVDAMDESSFVKRIVPPAWIIREGRTPSAQHPGRALLAKNPQLKAKIAGKSQKKKVQHISGVRKEMTHAWRNLDLTLTSEGTLYTGNSSEDRDPGPNHLNSVPDALAGGPRPPPPPPSVTSPVAAPSSTPATLEPTTAKPNGSPRPAAKPKPGADAMAMLGLTAGRGGASPA